MYNYLMPMGMSMYNFIGIFATVSLFLFNLMQLKRKKLLLGKTSQAVINYFSNERKNVILSNTTFWAFIETVIISYVQYMPPYNMLVGQWTGGKINYFGTIFIAPVILMILFYLLAVNPLKQMDLITPALPLALSISKVACFCQGCCRGIEWSSGLYNHNSGLYEFPVQLVESGIALLIFIFLLFWRKKAKDGTMFPTYLILYSSTRFFSEFLRWEPEVVWYLKEYHILCIIGVIAGIITLVIALTLGDKIVKLYSEYRPRLNLASKISSDIKVEYTTLKKKLTKKDKVIHHKKRKKNK